LLLLGLGRLATRDGPDALQATVTPRDFYILVLKLKNPRRLSTWCLTTEVKRGKKKIERRG
jgi:hypothetical protein